MLNPEHPIRCREIWNCVRNLIWDYYFLDSKWGKKSGELKVFTVDIQINPITMGRGGGLSINNLKTAYISTLKLLHVVFNKIFIFEHFIDVISNFFKILPCTLTFIFLTNRLWKFRLGKCITLSYLNSKGKGGGWKTPPPHLYLTKMVQSGLG